MLPARVLIVGDSIGLLRWLHGALERYGCAVSIGAGGPCPTLTLTRSSPDLLIVELGPGLGYLESWRRAIGSYRSRHPLSVLAIARRPLEDDEERFLEPIADLGVVVRPFAIAELIGRLDEEHRTEERARRLGERGRSG